MSIAISRLLPVRSVSRVQWLSLLGPAFAVSIGYIDPGNWATDLAAGVFGFRLLWVIVLANLLAIGLQVAVVKLTIISGEDLATSIARRWPRLAPPLWAVFQGAAIATDLAEFTGIVLGIQLLFHWNMLASVISGIAIVGVVLSFNGHRSKALEGTLMVMIGLIALVFLYQLWMLHPSMGAVTAGLMPQIPNVSALVLIIGIIGATVMPHNLFLHSSLVMKTCQGCDQEERKRRADFYFKETLAALNVAALINGAILIVGAALQGSNDSIQHAFAALTLATGSFGAMLFGGALLLTGIASSTTATLSGDYIFAGFTRKNISPLLRRSLTLGPVALLLILGVSATALLIWSQVVLALILPVAIVPMMLEYRRVHIRDHLSLKRPIYLGALAASSVCIAFDAVLIVQSIPWPRF